MFFLGGQGGDKGEGGGGKGGGWSFYFSHLLPEEHGHEARGSRTGMRQEDLYILLHEDTGSGTL